MAESSLTSQKSWTVPASNRTAQTGSVLRVRRSDAGFVVSLRFKDESERVREPYLCYLTADEWRAARQVSLSKFVGQISRKMRQRKEAGSFTELISRIDALQ